MKKRLFSLVLTFVLCVGMLPTAFAAGEGMDTALQTMYQETGARYAQQTLTAGNDWEMFGLLRSGMSVSDSTWRNYYQSITEYVRTEANEAGQLSSTKSTENSRVILTLTALGADPTDVGGVNLLTALSNLTYVKKQGLMGSVFALLAFDSAAYGIPTAASGTQTTRENLRETILSAQKTDGGWALSGDTADTDCTAMTVTALAPYASTDSTVQAAIDRALTCLHTLQKDSGGFSSYGVENAESCAQVIVALTALGQNPAGFTAASGKSVVDALKEYWLGNGQFAHTAGGAADNSATVQAFYALAAYDRFLNGKTTLHNMTDVTKNPVFASLPFADVTFTSWYHDAVQFAYQNSLFNGTNPDTFSPDMAMTRGMLVTVLYRMEKEPSVSGSMAFSDVSADKYYAKAVLWANQNSIVNGMSATSFAPETNITREQMAALLLRYAAYKKYDTTARADLSGYTDANSISGWARDAMQWANAEKLISGVTETTLAPSNSATRAQVATILMRFFNTIAK